MKRLILLLAPIAMVFASCQGGNTPANNVNNQADSVGRIPSGQIAFVRLDSLMMNYQMYIDLTEEFEAKARKAEADITSRGRSLERSVADFQEKIERSLVTRAEANQMQEDLQRREQSFYQYRDNLQMELAEENQVLTNRIYFSLEDFVKEFNNDYRYSLILTTTGGAPVLHGDPALDITSVVLKGLNERYARDKGK